MHVTPWRPFQDLDDFVGRYARLLKRGLHHDDNGNTFGSWSPSADISETKKEFLIKAELPDVDKKDIRVSVKDGTLTIEGERRHEEEEEGETFHRVESVYGKFSRAFALPANVDESAVKADYRNGMLRVRLPKTEVTETRKAKDIKVT